MLPLRLTELIGRNEAIETLVPLLRDHRLVTLAGYGGIGKSSLALAVAHQLKADFEGAVWLIELSSLADARLVPSAVARAIGDRRLLLILDSCEHLIDAAARLAETILRLCPQATLLATSRDLLRVEGEVIYRVESLNLAPARLGDQRRPGRLRRNAAVYPARQFPARGLEARLR